MVLLLGEHGASGDGRYSDGDNAHRGPEVENVQGPAVKTANSPARSRGAGPHRVAIRYKLTAAMALPLVIFIVVLGFEVRKIDRQTDEVRRQTALATAADGPSGLLTSLQDERSWAAVELIGQGGQVTVAVEGYDETRRRTDEALAGFQELLENSGEETREAYAPALEALAGLETLRQRIDANDAERSILNAAFGDEMFASYGQMIEPFFEGTTQIALAIDQPELRQGANLVDLSSRQIETTANISRSTIITSLLTEGGINEQQEITELANLMARFRRYTDAIEADTTGLYADTGSEAMFVDFTEGLNQRAAEAMRGEFNLEAFLATVTVPNEDSYNGHRQRVAETLRAEAKALHDDAVWRERLYIALIALTVLVALVITFAVSRSITRPLQSLTYQAVDMANHRLARAISRVLRTPLGEDVTVPQMEAIEVETGDEVADVAEVLNTVQDSALELAVGQAVMRRNLADSFVNLGRRNQNLLSRQLDFITGLEHNEADPDTLGHLFQLDHLATRMRRNAESLLVLAGNESPRKWTAPVRITDIIRAAVSEVEDYQRVIVRIVEPITIAGTAAADLAHLMAELIENSLLFSPSDETVEIRGLTQPAGYTLAIIDTGLGMSSDEIARANRRLAGAESFTVAPSKYLGHYVAGNLAVRHNIYVRLQHSPGAGVTATVHLPEAIAADGADEVPMLPAGMPR